MPVAVSEQIASELFSRLQLLVTEAWVESDVSEVVRPTRLDAFTPKHLQVVLTQDSPQINSELSLPGNPPATAYDMTFNVRCHVMPSEKDTTAVDDHINKLAADVVRAVTNNAASDWHTMGGVAINATLQPHENIDADGSFDGVNVPVEITFRTDETNPFNARA